MSACVTGLLICSLTLPATYMHSGHVKSFGRLLLCLTFNCKLKLAGQSAQPTLSAYQKSHMSTHKCASMLLLLLLLYW